MENKTKSFDFVKYESDGTFTILGNKKGYPRYTAVIPAPDCNHLTEESQEKTHREACENIVLQGYFITFKKRIRNTAFDHSNQKTTLKIRYRPCRTPDEMKTIAAEIKKILTLRGERQ